MPSICSQLLERMKEEFAECKESVRDELVNKVISHLEATDAAYSASSSKSGTKKDFMSQDLFMRMTGALIEELLFAKDVQSKFNYVRDYYRELKRLTLEKKVQLEIRQKRKQELQELKKDPNPKYPPRLTKKGQAKLAKQKQTYQMEIRKLQKRVDKYNRKEVDMSAPEDELDESAFIRVHQMTRRIILLQKKLNEMDGVPFIVPRALTDKFKYSESGYPVLDDAVVRFVTKRFKENNFDAPDFQEMSNLVNECELALSPMDLTSLCVRVFEGVCRQIKKRRTAESMDVFHGYESDEDQSQIPMPEDTDPELKAKLDANDSVKKSEKQILDEFVNRYEGLSAEEKIRLEAEESASGSEKDEEENSESGDEIVLSDHSSDSSGDEDEEEEDIADELPDQATAGETAPSDDPVVQEMKDDPEVPLTPDPVTNSNGVKRPPPEAQAMDSVITLDGDEADEIPDQPSKRRRMEGPSDLNIRPIAKPGSKESPDVPVDWQIPAKQAFDVVDLCSDDDD